MKLAKKKIILNNKNSHLRTSQTNQKLKMMSHLTKTKLMNKKKIKRCKTNKIMSISLRIH